MPGTPWWPTKQIWRQLCTSCRWVQMQPWAGNQRLAGACSVQPCSLAGMTQQCSEPLQPGTQAQLQPEPLATCKTGLAGAPGQPGSCCGHCQGTPGPDSGGAGGG